MSRRVLFEDLPEGARFIIAECAQSDNWHGKDPLQLFIELGELAEAEGFHDIYDYIAFYMRTQS
jgi:hypothetical protein